MLLCVQRALLCICVSLLQVNSLGVNVALCSVHCCVMCVLVARQQLRGVFCSVQRALLCHVCSSLACSTPPPWSSGMLSTSRVADLGLIPAFSMGYFLGQGIPVT